MKKGTVYNANDKTKSLILTGLFAALTAAGAFIRVPMWPVGITLQVCDRPFGHAARRAHGSRKSGDLPAHRPRRRPGVFGRRGMRVYRAPSFGFLVGLMPMAFVIGTLARKRDGLPGLFAAGLAGVATLYAVGIPYMYRRKCVHGDKDVAVDRGEYRDARFCRGDLIKILAAALILRRILRWTDKPPA